MISEKNDNNNKKQTSVKIFAKWIDLPQLKREEFGGL